MLSVVCCLVFGVCCLLGDVRCVLSVVGCKLPVDCCLLIAVLRFAVFLFVACRSLLLCVVCGMLFDVGDFIFDARCVLFVVDCLLSG